jgi:hypothetical protein
MIADITAIAMVVLVSAQLGLIWGIIGFLMLSTANRMTGVGWFESLKS